MSSTSKLFQFSCNSSKMFSTTPGYSRTVGAGQDKVWHQHGVDRETVDTMHTADWGRRDKNMGVKEEIKLMVREEVSWAKKEQRGNISKAWTQFQ